MNIKQLTQKITDEIENSLSNMSGYFDNPHVKITTINARIGQVSSSIQSINNLTEDIFSKENGWVIDFEFQPSNESNIANTATNTVKDDFETISTMPWFEKLPVKAIKGLGHTWEDRFIALGITTIGELLFSNSESIKKLTDDYDSVEPIAFKRMSELLDVTLPLSVFKTYSDLTLADLINESAKFSDNELEIKRQAQITTDFINNCLLCIDQKYLTKVFLK